MESTSAGQGGAAVAADTASELAAELPFSSGTRLQATLFHGFARLLGVPPHPGPLRPWEHAPLRGSYDVDSLENRDPWFVERVLDVVERYMRPYHRATVRGVDQVPPGAALYVGNHSGGSMSVDSFIAANALYRAHGLSAMPYVLTHDFALRLPGLRNTLVPLGAVRATPDNARRLFLAGRKVLVYPGGDRESMRPFRERNRICFHGRRGYVRLALRNDVPIVPVVGQGAHQGFFIVDDLVWLARLLGVDRSLRVKSWPLTLSIPWGLTFFPPPVYLPLPVKIRMAVLPPIRFDRSGEEAATDEDYVAACAARVERAMQAALDELAAQED